MNLRIKKEYINTKVTIQSKGSTIEFDTSKPRDYDRLLFKYPKFDFVFEEDKPKRKRKVKKKVEDELICECNGMDYGYLNLCDYCKKPDRKEENDNERGDK